jgi:hypothetical protein
MSINARKEFSMKKKIFYVTLILAVVLGAAGCATTERHVAGRVPQFVRDALRNAPENALVGIGTAKMSTVGQSRIIAATRGRADLSRQINSIAIVYLCRQSKNIIP